MSMREEELQQKWRELCASSGSDIRDLFETIPAISPPQQRVYLVTLAYAERYQRTDLLTVLTRWAQLQRENRSSLRFAKMLEAKSLHDYMKQQQKAMVRPQ